LGLDEVAAGDHRRATNLRIALIRHPRPDVAAGVCYGRLDMGLADGVELAPILAQLGDFAPRVVWASPALRCRALAEAIGAPRYDPRLLELDFGTWEGVAWDDVPCAALDEWAADPLRFAPPGGESGACLIARVASFARDLLAAGENAAVVAHGGPLRLLPALLSGREPDLFAPSQPVGSVVWETLRFPTLRNCR
jgi:alpha-ribazole phosphatase